MKEKPIKMSLNPQHINKDVWFYESKKKLLFTVYIGRKSFLFDVPIRKIKKSIERIEKASTPNTE